MRFELDKILTDEILFYMENQNGEFLLDTQEVKIIDIDKINVDDRRDFNDENRFLPLPKWDSGDGFRLMEKFAAELKNPVIRYELSAALNAKRGVFRSFKIALEQYPEAEKLWLNFKNKKMKEQVISWYNVLREEWGLEPFGGEPEDISGIILEDFIFREGKESDEPEMSALHRICIDNLNKDEKRILIEEKNNDFNSGDICIVAETLGGEFCGYIRAEKKCDFFKITRLEVKPEYRGMGVGKTLLAKLPEKTAGQSIVFDLPVNSEFFARVLHIEGFKPAMQRFVKV